MIEIYARTAVLAPQSSNEPPSLLGSSPLHTTLEAWSSKAAGGIWCSDEEGTNDFHAVA